MKSLNALSLALGVFIGIAINSAMVALETVSKVESKSQFLKVGECGRILGDERIRTVTATLGSEVEVTYRTEYSDGSATVNLSTNNQAELLKVPCSQ